ncbi:MAG: ABC transporter substrate-binding protein [Armatimonadota bacterium]|nr:ABC transporter substrate-binding protein [Armatimonadota bacterium]
MRRMSGWEAVCLLLAVVGLVAAPFLSAGNAVAQQREPILVGEIVSASGAFAVHQHGHHGATLAVEEINAKGGVLGRPLQLITRDDKSSGEEGVKAFRELAGMGVVAVVGHSFGATVLAASPLARDMRIPYLVNMGYTAEITEKDGHPYVFRTFTNERVFTRAFAEMVAKLPARRYCTIAVDFVYGRSGTAQILGSLRALRRDVEVLPGCQYWVPIGQMDFTPYITAILGQKPDALLFAGMVAAPGEAFVKQAKAFRVFEQMQGLHPTLAMPGNSAGLRREDIPEGILTGSDLPYPPPRPELRTFVEAYRRRWNHLPTEAAVHAYASIYLLKAGLEKAKQVDREALARALPGMTYLHPSHGWVKLRPFDNQSTAGWWFGRLTWDPTYGRAGLADPRYVEGEKYLLGEEQIRRLRALGR